MLFHLLPSSVLGIHLHLYKAVHYILRSLSQLGVVVKREALSSPCRMQTLVRFCFLCLVSFFSISYKGKTPTIYFSIFHYTTDQFYHSLGSSLSLFFISSLICFHCLDVKLLDGWGSFSSTINHDLSLTKKKMVFQF